MKCRFPKYFIRYCPHEKKVDYTLLLSLYDIAEYNEAEKTHNLIYYKTQEELADRLGTSLSTVKKIFSLAEYENFLEIDKRIKCIHIKSRIQAGDKKVKFVVLSSKEVDIIRKVNQRKFERYLIYTKYYCGISNNTTDFTAKQFLQEFDYSVKQAIDCSEYNRLLVEEYKVLQITKYTDDLGHKRNRYYWEGAVYKK